LPVGGSSLREGSSTDDLSLALNGERMRALRGSIRAGARAECRTCVCSMWRDLGDIGAGADSVRFAMGALA
jgi:hypothetical protein